MNIKRGYVQAYVLLALLFVIINVTNDVLGYLEISIPYGEGILALVTFLFFAYNIVTVTYFVRGSAPGMLLVLPVYYVISVLLFFALGLILGTFNVLESAGFYLLLASVALSIFEIYFIIYLMFSYEPSPEEANPQRVSWNQLG